MPSSAAGALSVAADMPAVATGRVEPRPAPGPLRRERSVSQNIARVASRLPSMYSFRMTDLASAERVLVHLFRDGYHRNVVAIARALRMDQPAVKLELDRLVNEGLARLKVVQGHLYWGITDDGRSYVQARLAAEGSGEGATVI